MMKADHCRSVNGGIGRRFAGVGHVPKWAGSGPSVRAPWWGPHLRSGTRRVGLGVGRRWSVGRGEQVAATFAGLNKEADREVGAPWA